MVTVEAKQYSPPGESFSPRESFDLSHEAQIKQALDMLRVNFKGYELYKAGLPRYPRPFFRDTAIASRLFSDPRMMAHGLSFARALQATEIDSRSGAKPGKIFHEYDLETEGGVELSDRPGKNTLFNSCDSNAEYVITHEEYASLTGDVSLGQSHRDSIQNAINWILEQVNDKGHFEENPALYGADSFALRVTFWKDSVLPGREGGEPKYPVVYPFAHIQNIAGLRSASRLLGRMDLAVQAHRMVNALPGLFDEELNCFLIAIDSQGPVQGISSDNLHALAYLEPGDIPVDVLDRMIRSSQALETDIGYKTLDSVSAQNTDDDYHTKTVWPHEQAEIHKAAKKHLEWAQRNGYRGLAEGFGHVLQVSQRPKQYYLENPGGFPELFLVNSSIKPSGCNPQLWGAAAADYFLRQAA